MSETKYPLNQNGMIEMTVHIDRGIGGEVYDEIVEIDPDAIAGLSDEDVEKEFEEEAREAFFNVCNYSYTIKGADQS